MAKATFAAGCFWGVEATFRQLSGVANTIVGYTGGTTTNPTYQQVCGHTTGHAEAVLIEFDPEQISYEELIEVFWNCHNPTQYHRQGVDVGSQYRSAIFYHDERQRLTAELSKQRLEKEKRFAHPIVTEILPATEFYKAEEYHQRYFEKNKISHCSIEKKDSEK